MEFLLLLLLLPFVFHIAGGIQQVRTFLKIGGKRRRLI